MDDAVYYPLIQTPIGKVPLVGSTMTDEREREIAEKYPVLRERDCKVALHRAFRHILRRSPSSPVRERKGRYSY